MYRRNSYGSAKAFFRVRIALQYEKKGMKTSQKTMKHYNVNGRESSVPLLAVRKVNTIQFKARSIVKWFISSELQKVGNYQ